MKQYENYAVWPRQITNDELEEYIQAFCRMVHEYSSVPASVMDLKQ